MISGARRLGIRRQSIRRLSRKLWLVPLGRL